jgi:hypothetical protein
MHQVVNASFERHKGLFPGFSAFETRFREQKVWVDRNRRAKYLFFVSVGRKRAMTGGSRGVVAGSRTGTGSVPANIFQQRQKLAAATVDCRSISF